jgi:hypothetical protein
MSNEVTKPDYQTIPDHAVDVSHIEENNRYAANTQNNNANAIPNENQNNNPNQNQHVGNPYEIERDITSQLKSAWISHISSIIFSCIFYFLFLSYTTNPEHFGSEKLCIELLRVAKGLSNLYYTLIILNLVLLILLCCVENKCILTFYIVGQLINIFYVLIMFIIYLIGMTNAVNLGEKCGDLHTLSIVWLIIAYTMLILPCVCCSCIVCCMMLGHSLLRNNGNNQ